MIAEGTATPFRVPQYPPLRNTEARPSSMPFGWFGHSSADAKRHTRWRLSDVSKTCVARAPCSRSWPNRDRDRRTFGKTFERVDDQIRHGEFVHRLSNVTGLPNEWMAIVAGINRVSG